MDKKIEQITEIFNDKLKQIDHNEIVTYMRLMEYRSALYRIEKSQEEQKIETFKKQFFERAKKQMHLPDKLKDMDEVERFAEAHITNVTNLLQEYKNAIKQHFQENNLSLYTIRGHKHETISRSKNIVNQYEAEKGDWVFAASIPKNKNAYRIRSAKHGMIGISDNESLILGDIVHLQEGKLLLDTPAYYYTLKCDKFMPVVRINNTREDANDFRFVFGEEWTSDEDIQREDMVSVEEYADVTDLLDNMQLFSTTDEHTIRTLSDAKGNCEKRRDIIRDGVRAGAVRYWNMELDRNVSEFYEKKEPMREDSTEKYSTLLQSAVEVTEGYVKTSDINKQVRNIQEAIIQRGRENKTREEKS